MEELLVGFMDITLGVIEISLDIIELFKIDISHGIEIG